MIQPHLSGISDLRQYILENQQDFPLEKEAIKTSRNKKHEAHKRWERYMRKLPVTVLMVNDINNYISVETKISKSITLCKNFKDELFVKIKNKNNFKINAEIELKQNSIINYPKNNKNVVFLSKKTDNVFFNYINNGNATFSLPANKELYVKIPIVYNCNGRKDNNLKLKNIDISHKINLSGYIYNKDKKELYRVTSTNNKTSIINITKN